MIAVSASVLMMIARWNSPFAAGIALSIAVFPPPPDCPKIVTLPGLPPNCAMLSRTHSSASTRSSMPRLAGLREALAGRAVRQPQIAERVQPVGDGDDDDVVLPRELGAVVEDRVARAGRWPPPWNQTITGRRPRPVAGVQTLRRRQSSPIGPLPVSASPISGIIGAERLRRARAVLERVAHAGPGLWLLTGGMNRLAPAVDAP